MAAKRVFRKLLKGLRYAPRVLATDKLKSYAAAKKDLKLDSKHRQSRYLNNACEVSHQPRCWMAPEMPTAMYSSGATILPVWPTW